MLILVMSTVGAVMVRRLSTIFNQSFISLFPQIFKLVCAKVTLTVPGNLGETKIDWSPSIGRDFPEADVHMHLLITLSDERAYRN